MPDSEIDYSDIPPLDKHFWKHAKLVMPETKERISLSLDKDLLTFFRKGGKGYQTRISAVLRSYMQAVTSH